MQNSHLLIWQVGVVIYYTHGCSNVNAKLFGEKLVVMNPFPRWYAYERTNSAPITMKVWETAWNYMVKKFEKWGHMEMYGELLRYEKVVCATIPNFIYCKTP